VTKKLRTWDMDNYIGDYKDYQDKELKRAKIRSSMTKNRFAQVPQTGYSKYFLLNGKKMNIENTNLDSINDNMKSRGIAKLFKKLLMYNYEKKGVQHYDRLKHKSKRTSISFV